MDPELMWALVGVAAIVAAVGGWYVWRQRRTQQLKSRFGREYDRTVQTTGDVAKAEAALEAREKRVARLHIIKLTRGDADKFSEAWRRVQAQFVDDPRVAITEADRLVGEVMDARGYPVGEFERRVEDISVDHPNVVMNYRAARDIAQEHARGHASTEDLRQAMVHYRALFQDLLETTPDAQEPAHQLTDVPRGRL